MARFKTAWCLILVVILLPIEANGSDPATAPEGVPRASKSVETKTPRTQPESKQMRSRSVQQDIFGSRYERGGSWLGVQLAPMPAALAAHLKLDDKGVMVRNVFKDSPAHRAGIARYDVIVAVDGEELEPGTAMLSDMIRSYRPGDSVILTLYKHGSRKTQTVKLARLPSGSDQMVLNYDDDWDAAESQLYGMYGGGMQRLPGGWGYDDLDEWMMLPRYDSHRRRPVHPELRDRRTKGIEGYEDEALRSKDGVREYMRKYSGPSALRGPGRQVPEARFDVRPDGSITAHVQDGPTELSMTFSDEQMFRHEAPRLYEQYRNTVDKIK